MTYQYTSYQEIDQECMPEVLISNEKREIGENLLCDRKTTLDVCKLLNGESVYLLIRRE